VKKCIHCGNENDDASVLCVCGQELSQDTAPTPTAPTGAEANAPAVEPQKEPRLILRKVLFLVGTLALMTVYCLFRYKLKTYPLYSSLAVTGLWCATAVAGLWFLGREKRPLLLGWRIAFLVIAAYFLPLILNISDGLMEFGWPGNDRMNRPISRILRLLIPLAASGFLTGLIMQIRSYRIAGVLAFLSGITSIVLGVFMIPATKSLMRLSITLGEVLNNIMFQAKYETYAAFPLGVAFVVGGILIFWAARSGARA
jgi:hypothetical protein